jgi:hypothetical protein
MTDEQAIRDSLRRRQNSINFSDLKDVAINAVRLHTILGPTTEYTGEFVNKLVTHHPEVFNQLTKQGDLYFHEAIINHHMSLRWVDQGMSVFDITASLLASLLLTDCDNVELDEVRFPFPTFAIRLPSKFWSMLDDLTGFQTDVNVLWVHHLKALDRDDLPQGVNFVDENIVKGEDFESYVKDRLLIRAVGRTGIAVWEVRDVPCQSESVASWVDTDHGIVESLTQHKIAETELHMQKAIRRLLVNLCLYIVERGKGTKLGGKRDTKKKRKRKKAKPKKQQKEEPRPNVWLLGQEVKLNKNLIQAARDWSEQDKQQQGARWKVKKRFIVQGHWRNQAYGPGRSLRKRIRIEPFWKGPEEGTKMSHLYKIEDGKDK